MEVKFIKYHINELLGEIFNGYLKKKTLLLCTQPKEL